MSFDDVTLRSIEEAVTEVKHGGHYVFPKRSGGLGIDDFVREVLCKLLSFRTRREEEDRERELKKGKEEDEISAKTQRMIDLHKVWRNNDPVNHAAGAELVELMEENADLIIDALRGALKIKGGNS